MVGVCSALMGSVVPGGAMILSVERSALILVVRLSCPEKAEWLHEKHTIIQP